LASDNFWEKFSTGRRGGRDTSVSQHLGYTELAPRGTARLVVSHQVIVLCFRNLLENMEEKRILAIDRAGDAANCS
jgi:hypothetical protein